MKSPVERPSRRRHNNFDLLRLAGAFLVLFSHSLGELYPREQDWLYSCTGGNYPMSSAGLIIFFSISGYLVTESLLGSSSMYQYAWKRFLRIWPAYFVITLITVFVLGPLVTSFSLLNYFANPLTWKFLFKSSLILNHPKRLPGVFDGRNVNISAWTLPVEMRLYAMLLILYLCRFFQYRWLLGLLFVSAIIIKVFVSPHLMQQWFYFDFTVWYSLGFFFLTGSMLYAWRDKIKLHYAGVFLLAILWLIAGLAHFATQTAGAVFCTYTVLFIGLRLPVLFQPPIDISYGIYLYGTPSVLTAAWLTHHQLRVWQYWCMVVPVIILLGYLSWKLVESKALRLKNKVI